MLRSLSLALIQVKATGVRAVEARAAGGRNAPARTACRNAAAWVARVGLQGFGGNMPRVTQSSVWRKRATAITMDSSISTTSAPASTVRSEKPDPFSRMPRTMRR